MSIRGSAFIVGAYGHPGRRLEDRSTLQTFRDVAHGVDALAIGMAVTAVCDRLNDECAIVRFRPAEGG
jgi:hypothetical protein